VITLIIALAATAAYLVIGWRFIAPTWVTREVARQVEAYRFSAADPAEVAGWRRTAAGEGVALGLIWPVYLLGRFLLGKVADAAPLTDFEAKRKIAGRDRRIAELERQLGIKP
jgi:hypothetical protein